MTIVAAPFSVSSEPAPANPLEKSSAGVGLIVVADAELVYAEFPTALKARTRNEYVVPGWRPVSGNDAAPTPAVATCDHALPPLMDSSIRKPVSLFALACHARFTWSPETAAAVKLM